MPANGMWDLIRGL